jgi:hypothetical protein
MSNDDEFSGRDARVMWRTFTTVAVVVAACIGGIVYGVSEWVRLVARVEAVEKWQTTKDRQAAQELWRRDREQRQIGPGVTR